MPESGTRDRPSVSVIIPAYNVGPYIAEAVASVANQTFSEPVEIIVVNDGSPDTAAIEKALAPFMDRIRYVTQENRGLSGARNRGIALSTAPWVALLDSDDKWHPTYLQTQMEILRSDFSIDVLYPNALNFGGSAEGGYDFMTTSPSDGPVTFTGLVMQTCNVMVSVTARREAIVAAGGFDESLRSSEDFDLWLRIVKSGGRIAYHRTPLVDYRRRPESLSADSVWMCDSFLRVLDKWRGSARLTAEEVDVVEKQVNHIQAKRDLFLGKRALAEGDYKEALTRLSSARDYYGTRKLRVITLLLKTFPQAVAQANRLRPLLPARRDSFTRY